MAEQYQNVEAEVVNDQPLEANVPQVKLNLGTTLQSPFFWLLAGIGLGLWLGWNKGGAKQTNPNPYWF